MMKAWELAREAQTIHGGKAYQYLSECLKQAWKILLADKTIQRIMKQHRAYNQYKRGAKLIMARTALIRSQLNISIPAYVSSSYGRGGDRYNSACYGR
jgi:hypothetical protein